MNQPMKQINRIVAQVVMVDRCGNRHQMIIRIYGNEITYHTGHQAVSNDWDVLKLNVIYENQSNEEIVQGAIKALLHGTIEKATVASEVEA